jgi:hypothetical protein
MLRFLKYIMLFVVGYKVLKMIFAEIKPKQTVPPSTPKQNINSDNFQQKTATSKFNDAEVIDYEEIK